MARITPIIHTATSIDGGTRVVVAALDHSMRIDVERRKRGAYQRVARTWHDLTPDAAVRLANYVAHTYVRRVRRMRRAA